MITCFSGWVSLGPDDKRDVHPDSTILSFSAIPPSGNPHLPILLCTSWSFPWFSSPAASATPASNHRPRAISRNLGQQSTIVTHRLPSAPLSYSDCWRRNVPAPALGRNLRRRKQERRDPRSPARLFGMSGTTPSLGRFHPSYPFGGLNRTCVFSCFPQMFFDHVTCLSGFPHEPPHSLELWIGDPGYPEFSSSHSSVLACYPQTNFMPWNSLATHK